MSRQDLEQDAYSLGALKKQGGKPSGRTKSAKPRRRALGIMALEPRIMYDAAATATAATAADTHNETSHADTTHSDPAPATPATDAAPTDSAPAAAAPRQDIVIIDGAVPDIQTLIDAVNPDARIFILQGDSDGVQQIADIIRDNSLHDLSSIQIVSHGGQGEVRLGSIILTDANLAAHAEALSAIGQALTVDGDILLYGCDVAQGPGGTQFLADLSNLTGADIAAATHDIGKTAQGQSWSLDAATGSIEATLPFTASLENYQGLLADPSLSATQTWSLVTDADSDGQVDPGDTITIAVTITNSGSGDATNVQFTETLQHLLDTNPNVRITPIAFNESYSGITGNTPMSYNAASGVLVNDIDPDSSTPFSNTGVTVDTGIGATNVVGGSVLLNADGSFTFTPTAGFTGAAGFDYTIVDAQSLTSVTTGHVTLNITGLVWYVDQANGSDTVGVGDGTYANPFASLAPLNTGGTSDSLDGANDTIFVYNNAAGSLIYSSGIVLEAGQKLIGDGVALSVNNLVIGNAADDAAHNPTLTSAGGVAITLNANNTIRGVDLGIATTAISGTGFGALTVDHVAIDSNGQALNLTNGSFAGGASFTSITSAGGTNNISLTTVTGSVNLGGGSLSGSSGAAFVVSGGTVSTAYSGSISTANVDVSVTGHTTGTLTFTGTITNTYSGGLGNSSLSFDNADGIYNFNGTNTLGHAAISIANGSSGTFAFSSGTTITDAYGTDFSVSNSDANVAFHGTISDSTGYIVDINNHDSGTITFDTGSLTSGGTGIRVQNSNGGTINFNNASIALTTAAAAAIDLGTSNSGGSVNFVTGAGAGLVVNTTSGTGILATGGGTVNVTGSNNTITSTTGTALNVANTTIGASGLNFKSISATGSSANAGIVLDNTGSSGRLTVTGSGSAGSGGTISNKTGGDILTGTNDGGQTTSGTGGTGIFLRNTNGPSLSYMQLNDFSNFAIYGNTVTGFNLTNSVISGSNGTSNAGNREESSIRFDNLLGTASISGGSISGGYNQNVDLHNRSGTLTRLTMDGISFGLINATGGNDNVRAQVYNSAVANYTLTNSTFAGAKADFVAFVANNNAAMDAVVRGNTFHDGQALIGSGGSYISVRSGSAGFASAATTTFDISHNTASDNNANSIGTAGIFVAKGQDNGTMSGTIASNTIVTKTGSFADGIFVRSAGAGTITVLIQNNTITNWGNMGIHLQNNDGSSTMNASVFGNSVTAPGVAFPLAALYADNGATGTDTSTMNLVVGSAVGGESTKQNTLVGGAGAIADVGLSNNSSNSHFNLSKNGSASATAAGVIADGNVGTPSVDTSGGSGPITLVTTLPALPAVVAPLFLAPGGVDAAQPDAPATDGSPSDASAPEETADETPELLPSDTADQPAPVVTNVNDGVLTQEALDAIVAAAIQRWEATGLSAEQSAYLHNASVTIEDLSGWSLGAATAGHIIIDIDGAGHGWFIDPTPFSDSEFANNTNGVLFTNADQAPAGNVDLLTTILHELGHLLGLTDTYSLGNMASIMYGFIVDGARRLPVAGEADGAVLGSITGMDFALGSVSIGTLPAGKSVTIYFDAVVADDQSNGLMQPATSQASVVSDGGFNATSDGDGGTAGIQVTSTTLDSLTLGGTVWNDDGVGGGTVANGIKDGTETGVNGVLVTVFADNGTTAGVWDASDAFIATTTTAGGGNYSFANLARGEYVVRVDQDNFDTGGNVSLFTPGLVNSSITTPEPVDPDNNVDNDDNGARVLGQAAYSSAITLAYNTEPTAGNGNDTNTTLDFGFYANVKPDLGSVAANAAYTENASSTVLSSGLTVTDGNDDNLAGATVTITDFIAGDVLAADAGATGINVVYNGAGLLTLSGSASKAAYEQVLRTVTYSSTSENPTAFGASTTRTVQWQLDDGQSVNNLSDLDTTTVAVTAQNDAPTATITNTTYGPVNEQTALDLKNTGLSVADVDAASVTVTLSVTEGILTVTTGGSGATVNNSGTSSVTITGSPTQINNLLGTDGTSTVSFINNSDAPVASVTLTLAVNDNGNTGGGNQTASDTASIGVTAVNDAPVATITPASYSATEQTALDLKSTMAIGDVDNPSGSATVTLSVGEGILTVATGTSGASVSNSGTASVTITGTVAQINALLATDGTSAVSYINNSNAPSANTTLTLSVNDGGNTGTPGALTGNDTATINITAVNDAPTIPTAPTQLAGTPGNPIAINGIVFNDSDSGGASVRAQITRDAGTLAATSSGGVTAVSDGSGGLFLYGSIADLNAYIAADKVTLTAAANTVVHVEINDQGNTGTGGAWISATSNINIIVDIPPSVTFDTVSFTDTGSSNSDGITNNGSVTMSGTYDDPDGTVTQVQVFNGATLLGTATLNASNWTLTATLGEGVYNQLKATATDNLAVTTDATNATSVTVDTTAAAPGAPDLDAASDSNINNDDITSDNTPTVSGTGAEAGATVTLFDTDGTTVLGTAVADGAGNWSITSSALADGAHTLTATQTDIAGTTSVASGALSVTIDTVAAAPTAPNLIAASDSNVNNDDITSDNTPTVNGSGAEAGATVTLFDTDGITVLGTAVANGSGNWLITSTALADGVHSLTAKQTDIAGITSVASSALSVTIDTAVAAPGAPNLDPASDSNVNNDDITSDNTPTVNGTGAEAGATVILFDTDGTTVLGTAVADGAGNWSITSSALADGVHTLTATQTDIAGTTSVASGALSVTIDTVAAAPTAPNLIAASDSNVNNDDITSDNTPTVNGSGAEAGATVTLFDTDGITVLGTAVANGSGNWLITSTALADGVHSLTAKQTDIAGNISVASSALSVTVDTTLPAAPGAPNLDPASDSNVNNDDITSDNTPTVNGSGAEAGATVTLFDTDGTTVLGTAVANGAGNWSITSSALADGVHSLTAKQTDIAGNVSTASGALSVTVDTTLPAAPSVPDLAAASDSSTNNDDITSDNTPTVNGSGAEAGATVTLFDTDGTTVLGTAVANGAGNWSITSSALADGVHSLTVKQTDIAGNVSAASGALSVTVDTTAPATPTDANGAANTVVEGAAANTTVGLIASSSDTNAFTYVLTGDTSGGGFQINSATGVISVADASKVDFESSGGSYTVTAQALDVAGNASSQTFVINVTDVAPVATGDSYVTDEDTLLAPNAAAGVQSNDSDVNGGTLTAVLDSGPANAASFTLNSDGSFSYTPVSNYNGPDSFTYHVSDGTLVSSTVTVNITVAAVNDAPGASISSGYEAKENVALNLKNAGMSVSDVDAGAATVTATLSVSEGALTVTAGTSGAAVAGSGTGTVTISGTLAQINALLNTDATSTVSFLDAAHPPANNVSLTLNVDDGGNTGSGSAQTIAATSTISMRRADNNHRDHGHDDHRGGRGGGNDGNDGNYGGYGGFGRFIGDFGLGNFFFDSGSFHVVNFVRAVLSRPDITASTGDGVFAIQVSLIDLFAPLGGNATEIFARQSNGDELPEWLRFDPTNGIFAGKIPAGATGTISLEVVARDSRGNEAITVFTLDLATGQIVTKEGRNLPLPGQNERDHAHQVRPNRFAAIEVPSDVEKLVERLAGRDRVAHAGTAPDSDELAALPLGRAGLSEQIGNAGWRGMHAQRIALLDSVRQHATSLH